MEDQDEEDDNSMNDNEEDDNDLNKSMISETSIADVIGPPQSISEIFECTSALLTYANNTSSSESESSSTSF